MLPILAAIVVAALLLDGLFSMAALWHLRRHTLPGARAPRLAASIYLGVAAALAAAAVAALIGLSLSR